MFAYPLFPLSVSSRRTDTWRSMRKSTTSERMTRKRSQGIPKPLFQSVQFPTLITTSNTLYQVKSCLWSLCFSVMYRCPVSACIRFLSHLLFSLKFILSVSRSVSALWLTQALSPHTGMIAAAHHFISAGCVQQMQSWSALRLSICTEIRLCHLFIEFLFSSVEFIVTNLRALSPIVLDNTLWCVTNSCEHVLASSRLHFLVLLWRLETLMSSCDTAFCKTSNCNFLVLNVWAFKHA